MGKIRCRSGGRPAQSGGTAPPHPPWCVPRQRFPEHPAGALEQPPQAPPPRPRAPSAGHPAAPSPPPVPAPVWEAPLPRASAAGTVPSPGPAWAASGSRGPAPPVPQPGPADLPPVGGRFSVPAAPAPSPERRAPGSAENQNSRWRSPPRWYLPPSPGRGRRSPAAPLSPTADCRHQPRQLAQQARTQPEGDLNLLFLPLVHLRRSLPSACGR